jgi:abnormal spindle-like microcephaly-associated protein
MTRDCLEKQRFAATILQACWRRFQAQLNFELDVLEVIYVQSAARRFLAQKQANKRRKAIQIIQKASRWFQAVRKVERLRQERLELEHISSLNEMASIIQCHWRSFASCIKYRVMVGDVITIQSVIRRHLVLKSIREQITAATMIQSIFRGHVVRCSLWLYHSHASSIQAIIRGYSARIRFIVDRMDIVVVQSFARRWLVRQSVARQKCSAIVIQSLVRQKVAERELIKMKAMKMFEDRETYSSVLIQSFWRGTRCRRVAAEHAAARKIQKTWRCFVTHIDFLVQVMSIMSIQASARRFLAQRSFEKRYTSLIKIQAVFRGNFNRKQIKKKQHSATIIQAAYRSYLDRSLFLYEKYSATAIQATTRGFLARINIEIEHFAACEIQRIWRGYNQFVDYVYTVMAVIKIQSAMRRCLAVKKFEDTKLGLWADQCFVNKKAALIQQAFRAHLYRERMSNAAKIIQVAFREYIERWKANMLSRATIRLQAAFRARAVRQKRTRTITDIAHKIHRANVRAKQDPKQKLGFRTSNALTVLQTSTSLAEIMGAVKTLESSTRLSVNCCEVFTKASAAKILLDLIRACNRSLPHVELVHWILLTLENVGQHKAFLSSFSDCKSAEVFLDKVQMFRDKDGIFCLSVSLLRRVIHNDQNVLQFCGSYEHLKRLVSIHKLSLRRARPASIRHSNKKKKRKKFLKFERREVFDRTEALKALGHLISYIKLPISTPSGEKHFTF